MFDDVIDYHLNLIKTLVLKWLEYITQKKYYPSTGPFIQGLFQLLWVS